MTGTSWRTGLCHSLVGHGGLHSDKMNSWPQIKGGLPLHRPGHHKRGRRALALVQQAHMVTEMGQGGRTDGTTTYTPHHPHSPRTEDGERGRGERSSVKVCSTWFLQCVLQYVVSDQ
ncbi:hypothetical protein NL108_017118 [Boleophthalmus pectinirostris]|nr:hypothetical protein NL108_017118 [Boleophthalmus pectinirostris]